MEIKKYAENEAASEIQFNSLTSFEDSFSSFFASSQLTATKMSAKLKINEKQRILLVFGFSLFSEVK